MSARSPSGSNSSLDQVYRETTLPQASSSQIVDSFKRVISLSSSSKKSDPLLNQSTSGTAVVMKRQGISTVSGYRITDHQIYKMPTAMPEEAALLDGITWDTTMDDMELRNMQIQYPVARRMSNDGSCSEVRVHTDHGDLFICVQGTQGKPAIITYHDLGLNHVASFQSFFNFVDMRAFLHNFWVIHVNAPGQEEGAYTLDDDFIFPTMDQLANQITHVLNHFRLRTFIGFGIGAGANVLARYALNNPLKVDALALINCSSTSAGWIEWGYQKRNSKFLRLRGMTQGVLDYFLWHHFGRNVQDRNQDLVNVYRHYFTRKVNPINLAKFIDAYVHRSDLEISRGTLTTIQMPVLNVTGAFSPHVEDTITLNKRLNVASSTWIKISDCAMVLDEKPEKMAEVLRLFLQGEGFVAPLSPTKIYAYSRLSDGVRRRACRHQSPVIRITENPISEAVVC